MSGLLVVALWVGLVVWLSRMASAEDERAAEAFRRAVAKLRFDMDDAKARGQLDVPLELELLRSRQARVTATIQPSLAMDLAIQPRRSALWASENRLSPGFDSAFTLEAMDFDQAVELVKGDVGRLLVTADATGIEASVRDDAVTLLVPPLGAEKIVAAVRSANDLAVHLLSRRPLLRASSVERAFAKALQAVGKSLGAEVEPRVGRLELASPAGRLTLRVERTQKGAHATRLRFQFARRLPVELALSDERRRSGVERLLDPDIQTGDAELDAAFVVRGKDPDRVKALLDPPARRALLGLWRSVHTVRGDEHGIEAELPVTLTEPKKLLGIVEALRGAGEALGRHGQKQAYR